MKRILKVGMDVHSTNYTLCALEPVIGAEDRVLLALIFYRLLTNKGASWHAKIWYEGNYSYLAFPEANLTSQNISKVLKELGSEEVQRHFFEEYLSCIYGDDGATGIVTETGDGKKKSNHHQEQGL